MQGRPTQTPEVALQHILGDGDLDDNQKIAAILHLGLATFKQDIAIISHIDGDEYEVLYSAPAEGGIAPGTVFDLGVTYCILTLKFPIPLAIHNAEVSEYHRHPCREQFKLESYIGSRLFYNGKVYGTLNFSSPNPRSNFRHNDLRLIQDMAEAIDGLLHS